MFAFVGLVDSVIAHATLWCHCSEEKQQPSSPVLTCFRENKIRKKEDKVQLLICTGESLAQGVWECEDSRKLLRRYRWVS